MNFLMFVINPYFMPAKLYKGHWILVKIAGQLGH